MKTREDFEEEDYNKEIESRLNKKQAQNQRHYYKIHKDELLKKIEGKKRTSHLYSVVPLTDFYDFELKIESEKMTNGFVDRNNYINLIVGYLDLFFQRSTKNILDREYNLPTEIPYSHNLFKVFFNLKTIKTENHIVPLLLDYHLSNYKREKLFKNSRKNKTEFLQIIEFEVAAYLQKWSPFDYKGQGIEIVKWLREMKHRYNIVTHQAPPKNNVEVGEERIKSSEILQYLKQKHKDEFSDAEKNFIKDQFISKKEKKLKWEKSIKELLVMILMMNSKKYFIIDINDGSNWEAKKSMMRAFEIRYDVTFGQQLEPARLNRLDFKKFKNTMPYKVI